MLPKELQETVLLYLFCDEKCLLKNRYPTQEGSIYSKMQITSRVLFSNPPGYSLLDFPFCTPYVKEFFAWTTEKNFRQVIASRVQCALLARVLMEELDREYKVLIVSREKINHMTFFPMRLVIFEVGIGVVHNLPVGTHVQKLFCDQFPNTVDFETGLLDVQAFPEQSDRCVLL
jgi:hypothetical protein